MDDAVKRPNSFGAASRDTEDIGDELFHRPRRADAVQRADDKKCIAQPAIAIIPGSPRSRAFGNRRGQRGDDRAGFLEIAQLERNGGADDLVLPVDGESQPPHPLLPVIERALEKIAARALQRVLERLVGAEHHVHRPGQHERGLVLDLGNRRVRGETHRHLVAPEADMIAAGRALFDRRAVPMRDAEADGDTRHAGDRLDDAHQLRRPVGAAEILEAWREVGDAHLAAFSVGQLSDDDGGVANIIRRGLDLVVEHHIGEAFFLVARQQPAKDRVAVIARQAPPQNSRVRIDQGGGAPIANHGDIEPVIRHAILIYSLRASCRRARRT